MAPLSDISGRTAASKLAEPNVSSLYYSSSDSGGYPSASSVTSKVPLLFLNLAPGGGRGRDEGGGSLGFGSKTRPSDASVEDTRISRAEDQLRVVPILPCAL